MPINQEEKNALAMKQIQQYIADAEGKGDASDELTQKAMSNDSQLLDSIDNPADTEKSILNKWKKAPLNVKEPIGQAASPVGMASAKQMFGTSGYMSPIGASPVDDANQGAELKGNPKSILNDWTKPFGQNPGDMPVENKMGNERMNERADFDKARAQVQQNRNDARFGQSIAEFQNLPQSTYFQRLAGAGAPPQKARTTIFDRSEEELNQPLTDLAQNKALVEKQKQDDPNSNEAQVARAFLAKYNPDLAKQLEGKTAKEMAIIFPFLNKVIEEGGGVAKAEVAAKAKEAGAGGLRDAIWDDQTQRAQLAAMGITDRKQLDKYPDEALSKFVAPGLVASKANALKQTAEEKASQERKDAAELASARSLNNSKAEAEFRNSLPKDLPEALVEQASGLKNSNAAIEQFQANLDKTKDWSGKLGAVVPAIGSTGLLGSGAGKGATFNSDRHRTAIALARGLEGGMARPGNVEIIERIIPLGTDSDEVKAQKMDELRKFMESKQHALEAVIEGGNYKKNVVSGGQSSATPASSPKASTDEDKQAVDWAKANRGNPDAEQILKIHGIK